MKWMVKYSTSLVFLLVGLAFMFMPAKLDGQIEAPELQCVSGDSLFFSPVMPSCGPATGVVIYISDALDGPYRVLDSVMDLSSMNYVHDTSGIFYYYMQTIADCPLESPLNSDTLSNQRVLPSEFLGVSVEGNGIRLFWEKSDNPNTLDYIIFRSSPSGTVSIDTTSDTTYLDLNIDNSISQRYLILTRDVCGETSIFPPAHNSITIDTILQPCQNEQEFFVTPYKAWLDDGYQIYLYAQVQNSSDPPVLIDTFNSDGMVLVDDLLTSTSYCTYVVLENNRTGTQVRSSDVCFTPRFNKTVDELAIQNLSFTPGSPTELNIDWRWNSDASLKTAWLISNTDSLNVSMTRPLIDNNTRTISAVGGQAINITTIDSCDNLVNTPIRNAGLLDMQIDQSNLITFAHSSPLLSDNLLFTSAQMLLIDGTSSPRTVLDGLLSSETLTLNGNSYERDSLCFYIEYQFQDTLINSTILSNGPTACVSKFPSLFYPNAFSPNGVNFEFKPRTDRQFIPGYKLQVFDRYGSIIFETDDVTDGWKGLNENGRPLLSGTYLYRARIQNNSYEWETNGTVFLLR